MSCCRTVYDDQGCHARLGMATFCSRWRPKICIWCLATFWAVSVRSTTDGFCWTLFSSMVLLLSYKNQSIHRRRMDYPTATIGYE